jgi:hypothetical protein
MWLYLSVPFARILFEIRFEVTQVLFLKHLMGLISNKIDGVFVISRDILAHLSYLFVLLESRGINNLEIRIH